MGSMGFIGAIGFIGSISDPRVVVADNPEAYSHDSNKVKKGYRVVSREHRHWLIDHRVTGHHGISYH
jgi:hypothetical protein